MEKAIMHLEELKTWMDRIQVSGESVDCMAMARQKYRDAMAELQRVRKGGEAANG